MVLCMTVNPGWGGQAFLEHSLDRLRRLRELLGPDKAIEVDGGIEVGTARRCAAAGRHRVRGRHRGIRRSGPRRRR